MRGILAGFERYFGICVQGLKFRLRIDEEGVHCGQDHKSSYLNKTSHGKQVEKEWRWAQGNTLENRASL